MSVPLISLKYASKFSHSLFTNLIFFLYIVEIFISSTYFLSCSLTKNQQKCEEKTNEMGKSIKLVRRTRAFWWEDAGGGRSQPKGNCHKKWKKMKEFETKWKKKFHFGNFYKNYWIFFQNKQWLWVRGAYKNYLLLSIEN